MAVFLLNSFSFAALGSLDYYRISNMLCIFMPAVASLTQHFSYSSSHIKSSNSTSFAAVLKSMVTPYFFNWFATLITLFHVYVTSPWYLYVQFCMFLTPMLCTCELMQEKHKCTSPHNFHIMMGNFVFFAIEFLCQRQDEQQNRHSQLTSDCSLLSFPLIRMKSFQLVVC